MTDEELQARKFRLEQLKQAEDYLEEVLKNGTLPRRVYHQSQVLLAADYFLKLDHVPRGSEAIRRCEPKYFEDDLKEDMAKDPEFEKSVMEIAETLVKLGLIDATAIPPITQALAKA